MMAEEVIEATTSTGVKVAFSPDTIADFSWNRLADNTFGDPALEVVLDRDDAAGLTQRVFFSGKEAERVLWLLSFRYSEFVFAACKPASSISAFRG